MLAAAHAFIDDQAQTDRTKASYRRAWQWWERHCDALDVDPLEAPLSAFEEMLTTVKDNGEPLAWATVEARLAAIRDRYVRDGRVPAYKRPEHAGEWELLTRGYRRRYAQTSTATVPPLLRADMQAMLTADLGDSPWRRANRAGALLALDGRFTGPQLARLTPADVTPGADGGVVVAGRALPCEHAERATGVPWDCAACAVTAAAADQGTRLLEHGVKSWPHKFTALQARFEHLLTGETVPASGKQSLLLQPRPDLDAWTSAGLRRALVLTVLEDAAMPVNGLHWVRARAWTTIAWSCGLRSASDLIDVTRGQVIPDVNGRGYVLQLGATKTDQAGAARTTRSLPMGDGQSLSAGRVVAEYLCVRDACVGADADQPLLVKFDRGVPALRPWTVDTVTSQQLAAADINALAALAGITTRFTSYSPRKGYGQQADEDGWDIEQIQEGLRHLSLKHTLTYVASGNARKAARKLIEQAGAA